MAPSPPLSSPADYFSLTFDADAGRPYHLWVRMKADGDSWANDSVYVQFSGAVDSTGAPAYRIGTTAGAPVILEDRSGAGVHGWGWNDNGWASLGPPVTFAVGGPQTILIQAREDGVSIDQIVLSATTYLNTSPGALQNDTTIVSR